VNRITSGSKTKEEPIEVKMENDKNKNKAGGEEPRRCPRLRDQEDADRTKLAMKRATKKNEILGTETSHTVLDSSDDLLIEMNNKLGVVSSTDKNTHDIVSVIKSLEQTGKIVYEESKKRRISLRKLIC
jgi:hypothetical protein